jgi:hypothetical protein
MRSLAFSVWAKVDDKALNKQYGAVLILILFGSIDIDIDIDIDIGIVLLRINISIIRFTTPSSLLDLAMIPYICIKNQATTTLMQAQGMTYCIWAAQTTV